MKEADRQFAKKQFRLLLDQHIPTAENIYMDAFQAGFNKAKAEAEADFELEKKAAYQQANGDYEALLLLEDKVTSFRRLALTRQRQAKEALYAPESETVVDSKATSGRRVRVHNADGTIEYSDGSFGDGGSHVF